MLTYGPLRNLSCWSLDGGQIAYLRKPWSFSLYILHIYVVHKSVYPLMKEIYIYIYIQLFLHFRQFNSLFSPPKFQRTDQIKFDPTSQTPHRLHRNLPIPIATNQTFPSTVLQQPSTPHGELRRPPASADDLRPSHLQIASDQTSHFHWPATTLGELRRPRLLATSDLYWLALSAWILVASLFL